MRSNKHKDRTGQTFGQLFCLSVSKEKSDRVYMATCKCLACGSIKKYGSNSIRRRINPTCGCVKNARKRITPDLLTEKQYGNLHINSFVLGKGKYKGGSWYANCFCNLCKKDCCIKIEYIRAGTTNCGCSKAGTNVGTSHSNFAGYKEISKTWMSRMETRSKKRNLDFDLTIEYIWDLFIKQNRKCQLSGIPMTFGISPKDTTVSVDRKDINLGYTKDNIQLVHKYINVMKNVFTDDVFVTICRKIANKNTKIADVEIPDSWQFGLKSDRYE